MCYYKFRYLMIKIESLVIYQLRLHIEVDDWLLMMTINYL